MRALVPLFTAAALAIGGWLAFGIVTVRSLDAPARIGLLPPPSTILLFLLPLLAVSVMRSVRVRHQSPAEGSGNWRQALAVLLLLVPIALPWLPTPMPVGPLVWTGPLASGWWLAVVAYAYADAFTAVAARLSGLLRSSSRAPIVAAVMAGLALGLTAWHTAAQHPRGDEPDYLIITQSLLRDHDLRIEDNHARADYAVYHRGVLPPSYLRRGADGAIYSIHAPGLPALLAPGFELAGHRGAIATLVLVGMIGAWLAWRVSWRVTGDAAASWFGTLATVGAAPFFLHGSAIFPDAPASALALVAVSALLADARSDDARGDRGPGRAARAGEPGDATPAGTARWVIAACALGCLPWLHTRYAILAAGLGGAAVVRLVMRRHGRALVAFLVPGVVSAAAWLAFFWVVYGTPNPAAPYGAYTQMALAHLAPGLPGLLLDQQFGLLSSAPALVLALVAVRPRLRRTAARTWAVAAVLIGLAVAYTVTVGAYRMWWGGLSAPARFLVPLILPLAPLVASGWQSLRTRASRHLAVAALVASLALTVTLAVVDHGAVAYNERNGQARWAAWASPLADLSAALPAAHRDAPPVVLRDAAVWLLALGLAWVGWRAAERRSALTPLVSLVTLAAVPPVAATIVWRTHGTTGLAPATSQVHYLEARARTPAAVLATITPPPIGRTRTWFDVELDSPRNRSAADYTVLRLPRVPAGRYRLASTIDAAGARLGVTVGEERTTRFLADLAPLAGRASTAFTLALPVEGLVVKGSREAAAAPGRTWLRADEVWPDASPVTATRTYPFADGVWLLPPEDVFPEAAGLWIAGDADVMIGVSLDVPVPVTLGAGAAPVTVTAVGARDEEVSLAAGETKPATLVPRQGRLRVRTRGGFRPAQASPGSDDTRWLGVWIAPR